MTIFVYTFLGILCIALIGQAVVVRKLAHCLRSSQPVEIADTQLPKFCIGMTLRGADPHLPEAIRRILAQDYPNFELHFVIDSQNDPAWKIVEETVSECNAQNVRISELRNHHPTCSLYCSALAQYIDDLDDSTTLVGFCDGDSLVPPHWLREMAAAFVDPEVGGTLGNRWYIPMENGLGTIVRKAWNASAVPSMWLMELPWTSTLSMRYSDLIEMNFSDRLKQSLVEDAPSRDAIKDRGMKMKFLPQMMIPNYEDISLANCFHFVRRQTVFTRLYSSSWQKVFLGTIVRASLTLLPWILAPILFYQGDSLLGAITLSAGAIYWGSLFSLFSMLDRAVISVLPKTETFRKKRSIGGFLKTLLSIPLNQVMQVLAFCCCLSIRRMKWRGVTYEINGPWEIEVVENQKVPVAAGDNQSL